MQGGVRQGPSPRESKAHRDQKDEMRTARGKKGGKKGKGPVPTKTEGPAHERLSPPPTVEIVLVIVRS